MEIVEQRHFIETKIDGIEIIRHIEKSAKTCYKAEHNIGDIEKAKKFVKGLIKRGHTSTLEHFSVSVRFITDRGISHEIVRHRLCSFSQESTRYCNYERKGIQFIHPKELNLFQKVRREELFWEVQKLYNIEIEEGISPEIARGTLPHALKTEIVVTANLREWRHIFNLRVLGTTGRPHPQIKDLFHPVLEEFKTLIPVIFDDLQI